MKTLLIAIFLLFSITSFAQTDSSKIYHSKQLKKGFYRDYNDYINNSPFIITDFDIIPYRLSKKDTIIIAAEYRFGESKTQIPNTWGFCDGQSVYIHYPNHDMNPLFYKLEKIGPYPYFIYAEKKDMVGMGVVSTGALLSVLTSISTFNILGLASSIFSMTEPTHYSLLIATPDDKVKSAFNKNYMKKLFSKQPEILNAYQKAKDSLTINKIREFLFQYNERTK